MRILAKSPSLSVPTLNRHRPEFPQFVPCSGTLPSTKCWPKRRAATTRICNATHCPSVQAPAILHNSWWMIQYDRPCFECHECTPMPGNGQCQGQGRPHSKSSRPLSEPCIQIMINDTATRPSVHFVRWTHFENQCKLPFVQAAHMIRNVTGGNQMRLVLNAMLGNVTVQTVRKQRNDHVTFGAQIR